MDNIFAITTKNPLQPESYKGFGLYIEVHRVSPAGR